MSPIRRWPRSSPDGPRVSTPPAPPALGFVADDSYDDIIRAYIEDDLPQANSA